MVMQRRNYWSKGETIIFANSQAGQAQYQDSCISPTKHCIIDPKDIRIQNVISVTIGKNRLNAKIVFHIA